MRYIKDGALYGSDDHQLTITSQPTKKVFYRDGTAEISADYALTNLNLCYSYTKLDPDRMNLVNSSRIIERLLHFYNFDVPALATNNLDFSISQGDKVRGFMFAICDDSL